MAYSFNTHTELLGAHDSACWGDFSSTDLKQVSIALFTWTLKVEFKLST